MVVPCRRLILVAGLAFGTAAAARAEPGDTGGRRPAPAAPPALEANFLDALPPGLEDYWEASLP